MEGASTILINEQNYKMKLFCRKGFSSKDSVDTIAFENCPYLGFSNEQVGATYKIVSFFG